MLARNLPKPVARNIPQGSYEVEIKPKQVNELILKKSQASQPKSPNQREKIESRGCNIPDVYKQLKSYHEHH